ncbi:class I SAM-dependent methyltransferase [Chloroflexota bacterium]
MTEHRPYHEEITPEKRLRMLNSEGRAKWLRTDDLIKETGIGDGMTCIDLGCGIGTVSFPLSEAVGKQGTVYAVDTHIEALEIIREKNPPENLVTVNRDAANTGLDAGIADFCIIILLLHEIVPPDGILAEACRLLKPGGKAVVLEWIYDADIQGPPRAERLSREKLEQLFSAAGLSQPDYSEWTESLCLLTGSKPASG